MWPLIFGAVSAIGSAFYLWSDWRTSQDMAESVSQMEYYIQLLSNQITLQQFLEAAWPSLLAIGAIMIAGYIIATPKRRKEARA